MTATPTYSPKRIFAFALAALLLAIAPKPSTAEPVAEKEIIPPVQLNDDSQTPSEAKEADPGKSKVKFTQIITTSGTVSVGDHGIKAVKKKTAAKAMTAEKKVYPITKAGDEDKAMYKDAVAELQKQIAEPLGSLKDASESWFYIAGQRLSMLLTAFEYSGDTQLLDEYIKLQTFIISQRFIHPDKPEWNGWFHYKAGPRCLIDHESIIYDKPVLRFALAVNADPSLDEKYRKQAAKWVPDVLKTMKAWDQRGAFQDLGERGGWYIHTKVLPDEKGQLYAVPGDVHMGGSVPYNKLNEFVECLVLAYELTGETWYKDRAETCCKFFRSHWRTDEKHAEWNYRDHAFPGDYESGKVGVGKTKTGAFVHPRASYYTLDAGTVAACYKAGIFFTKADVELLIKTNLEFMWNKDKQNPKFGKIDGKPRKVEKYGWGEGFLWTSLAAFSPQIRELWKTQLDIMKKKHRYHWPNAALNYLLTTSQPVSWEQEAIPTPDHKAKTAADSRGDSNFFGLPIGKTDNVVYVVDRSGSMIDVFDAVRNEMLRSTKALNPKQTFHVILFGEGRPMQLKSRSLAPATPENKAKAFEFLKEVVAEGQTDVLPALKTAFSVIPESSKGGNIIFLLTDGDFRGKEPQVLQFLKAVNKDKKARINTILYGNTQLKSATEHLKKIAAANGGTFKAVEHKEN